MEEREELRICEPSDEEQIRRAVLQNRIARSGLPQQWRRPLDSWTTDSKEEERLLAGARRFVANFDKDNPRRSSSLIFVGSTGTGKTHLAASITYELCLKGVDVRCEILPRLFRQIKSTYNRDSEFDESYFFQRIEQAQVVFLDELTCPRSGKSATGWEVETLREIADMIELGDKVLIATGNLKRSDMELWLNDATTFSRLYNNAREVAGFSKFPDRRAQSIVTSEMFG